MTDPVLTDTELSVGTYPKWVGVVLSLILPGSAQYLAGDRRTGVLWYAAIIGCSLGALCVAAIPVPGLGVPAVLIYCAAPVLWLTMLVKSCRRVRRIGFRGWILVIAIPIILTPSLKYGVRTLVHPFKVPTGAMQPTIWGVHVRETAPGVMDRMPLKVAKWIVAGQWYKEIVTSTSGAFGRPRRTPRSPLGFTYDVGGREYPLPRGALPSVPVGVAS